ncbi:MAG TPA: hypothetical protein VHV30_06540 [Polyangiaceae bacterium]|jgi:hypothetical protein|nr:hypothetical protein [Polyangiaceae bacterium]
MTQEPRDSSREVLAHRADEVRARLVRTVVHLNERRQAAMHAAVSVPKQIERSVRRWGPPVAALALAAVVTVAVHAMATASRRLKRRSWRLLAPFSKGWRRPEGAARARRPFAVEVLRSLLVTVVTSVIALPFRRAIGELQGTTPNAAPRA